MARIYMVRHGRAAAGFGESHDPGLDELGQKQAEEVAGKINRKEHEGEIEVLG